MKKITLEQLEKAIREHMHTGRAVVITDFTNTNRKPDLAPKGRPYPGGVVAGTGIYRTNGSVTDLKAVESHESSANPPTPVQATRGDQTLRQRVLERWRG